MNQIVEISLDNLGHILIPAAIRSRLGLSPGLTLVVEKGAGEDLRLRIQSQPPSLIEKEGVLVVTAEPITDLMDITFLSQEKGITNEKVLKGLR
jgi:AbrB family looped-hinge helix DNA binding protein